MNGAKFALRLVTGLKPADPTFSLAGGALDPSSKTVVPLLPQEGRNPGRWYLPPGEPRARLVLRAAESDSSAAFIRLAVHRG